jgi:predicted DNA-binding transcriptional regulator AlpA
MTTTATTPVLPISAVAARLGVCVETVRRWVKSGRFPEPALAVHRRLFAWTEAQLQEYLSREVSS